MTKKWQPHGKSGPHTSRKTGGRFVPPTHVPAHPPHDDAHATPHDFPLKSHPKVELVQTSGEFEGGTNDPAWSNLHPSAHSSPREISNKMIK